MQLKSVNRQQNEKIKELLNQINHLNANYNDIKSKYEKQLKTNLDLKRQQEKLHSINRKSEKDDSDKVKTLEFQLDQTLVTLDSMKED